MRLPFIPPAELSPEQKLLYDDMKAGIAAKYSTFKTMRPDGAILGPWSAWLHDPDLGHALWGATKGMTRFRHLPEMVRGVDLVPSEGVATSTVMDLRGVLIPIDHL